MSRIGLAIEELHGAEHDLAIALTAAAERHRDDPDVRCVGRDLAEWSREHVRALADAGRDFGLALDQRPPDSTATAAGDAESTRGLAKDAGLSLLLDLRRLHRMAAGVSLDWEVLAQTAQALKNRELLDLTKRCHPDTLRQLRWTNATLKESAAQLMVSK